MLKPLTPRNKQANMVELTVGMIGKSRNKAIQTIAKKRGVSYEAARKIQAEAILNK